MFSVRLRLVDSIDSHQRRFPFPHSFSTQMQLCWREPMAQTTIAYLERRHAALESEIADALSQSPTDELAIADLMYRKLIIADEIQHNRLLVERTPLAWGARRQP
jgi:hypothetical protein